jgi:hypothetical protein
MKFSGKELTLKRVGNWIIQVVVVAFLGGLFVLWVVYGFSDLISKATASMISSFLVN